MNFKLGKINQKEIITCILLVIVGYMFAKLFTRMNAGFRVSGQSCDCTSKDDSNPPKCNDGGNPNQSLGRIRTFCTDQTTESNCKTAGGRTFVSPNTCKWTGPSAEHMYSEYYSILDGYNGNVYYFDKYNR